MAAVILENEEDFKNERFDSLDDMAQNTQETTEPLQEENLESSETEAVPDKYNGKSLEDVVRMHQEAEKLLGRQSSEVGDLRKVVDSYINTQLNDQQPEQPANDTDEDIDFYSDPEKAISKAIENHPSVKAAEESTRAYKQQTSMAILQKDHPEIPEIVKDPRFAEWIQASKIRTRMFVQADQHFDMEAASELFSLWKDRAGSINQTLQAEKAGRQKAVKEGSNGYTRGNPDSGTSKKIYRRTDIIKLMKTDPERYLALSDDITLAYAEKRVK
tara:strand:- start:4688 stop:5506 length:819 start_codon:yes stop_codon:yes gene_type:complete